MTDFKQHANILVEEYHQKRAKVLLKRRKRAEGNLEEKWQKALNYRRGLKTLSETLPDALGKYRSVFNSIPSLRCWVRVKSAYPDDLNVSIIINRHSLRFISKEYTEEQKTGTLIDGLLYCESSYKDQNRKIETQSVLVSEIGDNGWGIEGEDGEFSFFLKDGLPELIETLWNRATFGLIHASGE